MLEAAEVDSLGTHSKIGYGGLLRYMAMVAGLLGTWAPWARQTFWRRSWWLPSWILAGLGAGFPWHCVLFWLVHGATIGSTRRSPSSLARSNYSWASEMCSTGIGEFECIIPFARATLVWTGLRKQEQASKGEDGRAAARAWAAFLSWCGVGFLPEKKIAFLGRVGLSSCLIFCSFFLFLLSLFSTKKKC